MAGRIISVEALEKDFKEIANCYVKMLCAQWDLDEDYSYWAGDEIGLLYYEGGELAITYDDIRYCVKFEVNMQTYLDWQDYCEFCVEYGQTTPNFKSWHKGCPRISKETQNRLRKLKAEFEQACKETNEIIHSYS